MNYSIVDLYNDALNSVTRLINENKKLRNENVTLTTQAIQLEKLILESSYEIKNYEHIKEIINSNGITAEFKIEIMRRLLKNETK